MTHYYLLDNNVYTILRKTPNAIREFDISILNTGVIPVSNIKHLMTPYSVMEAVSVTMTNPNVVVPRELLLNGDVTAIFSFVLNEALIYYKSQISKDDFMAKAEIQRAFTLDEINAIELEKRCVQKPLTSANFEEYFSQHLAFDYAFKFDFPKQLEFDLNDIFFVNSFFTDHPFITRLSKFRLTKKFWGQIYPEILNANKHQLEIIEMLNKSMRLKNFKDYLDCDLIHFVTVGNYNGSSFRPTIGFTCDDPQTIVNRVMAYKTHIEFLKSNLDDNLSSIFGKTTEKWEQGILAFCNENGTVKDYIEVKNIQSLWSN